MVSIVSLLTAVDERTIFARVGNRHDAARMNYTRGVSVASDFDEFTHAIADYYNHHFSICVSNGGALSFPEAAGMAKQVLTQHYRQRGGDLMTAFADARGETSNGSMRQVYDLIADTLKADAVERYLRDVFDRHVNPSSWTDKVEAIRQFIMHVGPHNLSGIDAGHPERYAANFEVLIRAYVRSMQRASMVFRRF